MEIETRSAGSTRKGDREIGGSGNRELRQGGLSCFSRSAELPISRLALATAPSPLGPITFALHGDALCMLGFEVQEDDLLARLERRFQATAARDLESPAVARVRDALARYFSGELRALESLPLDGGGTHFQTTVWSALREIPAGETRSYGQIAARIGEPRAVRAVGLANGRNPIALAVPCHRVIGADGALTGYAGGLERKRWLLAHERR